MTTPKKPGPPPRTAHNKSGFCFSLATSTLPSAATTRAASMLKQAGPHVLEFQPRPPLNRKPLIGTVGQ